MHFLIVGEEIYDKPELLAKHLGYCPQVHSCTVFVYLNCFLFFFYLFMCVWYSLLLLLYVYITFHSLFLQFDALWDHVTPCEHLNFCARCRGYDEVISVTFYLDMSLRLQHMKRS